MNLNAEQQAAVSYLEGPLLVLAGPGTGKTQLLSAKVAYILEHTDTNPENILCLTFTESGANNMRERLGSMIGAAAANVNIYTYHAFGSNILERYKNYAETFNRRLEAPIDTVMQHKILRQIQEQLPATNILKTAGVDKLVETIQNAKAARLSADNLAKIATENLADSETIATAATPLLQAVRPRMKFTDALVEVYQPLLELFVAHSDSTPICGSIERTANLLARELKEIIDAEEAKDKPSVSPLTKWKTANFEPQADGSYRLKDYIANKKLAALAEIMSKYNTSLGAEGWFDFADMIEEAIRALKTDEGFRLSLEERFLYILLDEFQDTNPSQFELIKLLTAYERPAVMAVGDDDQAIFEFQGANASNLVDFQNHYHAKVITLVDNYRSTGEILDFSHQVATQVTDSFAKHHQVNKLLRSMRDLTDKTARRPSQIERHEFRTATQEYHWVASKIAELIQKGENPNEIAIIAPRHKYIAPLLPYLKQQDIQIAYEKRSNLLEDPKIRELLLLARFIFDLSNGRPLEYQLLEVLACPFLAIEPLAALRAIQNGRNQPQATLDYLAKSGDTKLAKIASWIAELAMRSTDTPLELWLNYLIGTTPLPENNLDVNYIAYYEESLTPAEKLDFYENLQALRDTVTTHTKETKLTLAELIAMLDDYMAAKMGIMKISTFQDGADAVQVMSAHKSKGLEFKHVFLIAVDDWAWGKAKGNNNTFVLPHNLTQIRHTGATDDERLRLLFVAITRAREHLVMTNSEQDFSGRTNARLAYLGEQRDEKAETQISPYLPIGHQDIQLHQEEFGIEENLDVTEVAWSTAYQQFTPDLELQIRANLENYRLTATDLTDFIDIIYAGPESIYRRRALRSPNSPLTEQIAYGNLVHATFEQISSQALPDNTALERFLSQADELPLSSQEIANLKSKGEYGLPIALQTFAGILRHPHAKAELNLAAEHLNFEGVPLTGKIDHINIDPETKTIEIYDFKTGNFHDQNWQSHFTLYKYALQLEFYKLLLNLSPTYRNYQIHQGHILFVSPDNDGLVHDKPYSFTSEGGERLRALVKVVYKLITSLEFAKNPTYNLAADNTRTLRDVKDFVNRLLEYQTS